MRTSLLFLALAVANGATVALSTVLRSTKYTSTSPSNSLSDYLGKLTPVAKDVLVNRIAGPAIGADPGVLITVLPEAGRPDYNIFWLRDALLAYHAWFIQLVLSPKDQQIRALVDDYVHALVMTQHVDNIAGNTFSRCAARSARAYCRRYKDFCYEGACEEEMSALAVPA